MAGVISLDALKKRRQVYYIDTLYGGQLGLRRLSTGTVMALRKAIGPDGAPADTDAANRMIVKASVIEPELDDEAVVALEDDARAYLDLINKILELNGLTAAAQKSAASDFRAGDQQPAEVPGAS